MQPGLSLLESSSKTDRLGTVLAAILAAAFSVLVSALAAAGRRSELRMLRALGLSAPQRVIGAGIALAISLALGSLGGAALLLSWQTAAITALAAALLSWISGRLGASGAMR